MANFEAFHYLGHFIIIKHKPLISEEWSTSNLIILVKIILVFFKTKIILNFCNTYNLWIKIALWKILKYLVFTKIIRLLIDHSSEIRGLCLMKWPSETLLKFTVKVNRSRSIFINFVNDFLKCFVSQIGFQFK